MLFPFKKPKTTLNPLSLNDLQNITEQPQIKHPNQFTSPKKQSKPKIKPLLLHKTQSPLHKPKLTHFPLIPSTPTHLKHKSILNPKQQSFLTLTSSTLSSSKTSSYFPTVPSSNRKTRNKSHLNNLYSSHTYKKYSNTNELITNLETTCTNLHNEITFMKRKIIEPSKLNVIENINEMINKDMKSYAKEEPKVNEVSIISRNMVIKSTYVSKVSEKFAHDAENVVYEMFNKEYYINKRKMDKHKQIRKNMQKKRLALRLITDCCIQNYNNTINKCYDMLKCKQECK